MTPEKWAGFTDEDIERMKLNPTASKSCPDKLCEMDGYTAASRNRRPMKIKKISKYEQTENLEESVNSEEFNCVSNDNKCNKENPLVANKKRASGLKSSDEDYQVEENCTCNYEFEENERVSPVTENIVDVFHEKGKEPDDSGNLLPLEIFEMKQKRIEAENARRRALISKAINDKKMRTQAEAIKLAKITQELNRIDSNLSADVSILRNYIEKASLEFSEAEKRYLKAEKEYVEAKLALFERMQRKEMLTEHLCAIIEQNENRKADKLVELMKQLEMEVILEDCGINGIPSILPNLCTLNDEPYYTCQTLKPGLFSNNSMERSISDASQTSDGEEKRTEMASPEIVSETLSNADDNPSTELVGEKSIVSK